MININLKIFSPKFCGSLQVLCHTKMLCSDQWAVASPLRALCFCTSPEGKYLLPIWPRECTTLCLNSETYSETWWARQTLGVLRVKFKKHQNRIEIIHSNKDKHEDNKAEFKTSVKQSIFGFLVKPTIPSQPSLTALNTLRPSFPVSPNSSGFPWRMLLYFLK